MMHVRDHVYEVECLHLKHFKKKIILTFGALQKFMLPKNGQKWIL